MKSSFSTIIIIFCCVLAVSCGKDNPSSTDPDPDPDPSENPDLVSRNIGTNGGDITSKDQLLTLTIPAGALDSETEIAIAELSGDDIPAELQDPTVRKVYDLQPNGLEFALPATVEVRTMGSPAPPGGAPLIGLVSESGGELELLGPLENTVDDTGIVARAPINHFSSLAMFEFDGATFSLSAEPSEVPVGGSFTLTLRISSSGDSDLSGMVRLEPISAAALDAVELQGDLDPPGFTLISGQEQQLTRSVTGTCVEPGSDGITVEVRGISLAATFFTFTSADDLVQQLRLTVVCVEAPTVALNVEKEGEGTVTSEDGQINCGENCSTEYDQGTEVTLKTTPEEGWVFDGWSGDVPDECGGETGDCMVSMDQARTVVAKFVEETALITFEELLVCIEHSSNESDIFWLFTLPNFTGKAIIATKVRRKTELHIVLHVTLPDGSQEEITLSSYSDDKALFHLDIFTVGTYEWEIVRVEVDGIEIAFEGLTDGTINVSGAVENPGECML